MAAVIDKEIDVKRGSIYHVYPQDIIVKPEENGRAFAPDIHGLIVKIVTQGGVKVPIGTRKVADNKLQLTKGYGRHAALAFINAHLEDGELAKLLEEAGYPNHPLPVEPLRLPCLVAANQNAKEAFLENISENRDRNATTPIDDAHNIRRLREMYHYSDEEIGKIYADSNGKPKSPAWITQTLKLTGLDDDEQKQVAQRVLSASSAIVLAEVPEEVRKEVLQDAKDEKKQKSGGKEAPVTPADIVKAARKKGVLSNKKACKKVPEIREMLLRHADKDNGMSLHCRRFCEALAGWIDDGVDEETMLKEFSKRFKE